MARFDVTVRRLNEVTAHPNADRLDLAMVGGYCVVVAKGQFRSGDLAAYIPEAAVVPTALIDELGLTGKLAGPDLNRVKAVHLRGMLSQGICVPARPHWVEGASVMAELCIVKYDPPIPDELKGSVYALEEHERLAFDIENIKAFPELIQEGEPVVFTEKVHGVFLAVGATPAAGARPEHRGGRTWVSSKGLLADRMAFQHTEDNADNLYLRTAARAGLHAAAVQLSDRWGQTVFLLGEAFGVGVQDLGYGQAAGAPCFRAFAVVRQTPYGPQYLDDGELELVLAELGLTRAPVLYRGPFSQTVLKQHTEGMETVSGNGAHLREGVIVSLQVERQDPAIGRVVLKSVSPAYLLRKGGTEYA